MPETKQTDDPDVDAATTELLRSLDELYPLADDGQRRERAGRTAAALKRWMGVRHAELEAAVPTIVAKFVRIRAQLGEGVKGEDFWLDELEFQLGRPTTPTGRNYLRTWLRAFAANVKRQQAAALSAAEADRDAAQRNTDEQFKLVDSLTTDLLIARSRITALEAEIGDWRRARREAFRAGFLAVWNQATEDKPARWSFDGVAAVDREPEAWAALSSSVPADPETQET